MLQHVRRVIRRALPYCLTGLLLLSILGPVLIGHPAVSEPVIDEEYDTPDTSKEVDPLTQSFSTAPPIDEVGRLNFRQVIRDAGLDPDEVLKDLGYDPSRSWQRGTALSDIILLGDLKDTGIFENLTLDSIGTASGRPAQTLADVAPMQWQTVTSLVKAIPSLGGAAVGSIPVILDAARSMGVPVDPGATLQSLLKDPKVADIMLGKAGLDLTKYALSSIPGLSGIPLGSLARFGESPITGIPGLSDIPLATLFSSLFQGGITATLDLPWGTKEARRLNTITGSYPVGFRFPCRQKHCAYVELSGNPIVHGKQWISGKSQKVRGGFGCLRGKEPTGRHPFGPVFKVALTKTVEADGRADFSLYFPLSVPCGNRLYVLGPLPFMSVHEKGSIFVGLVDPSEGETPPPETGSEPPPDSEGEPVDPEVPAGQDECEKYKGVNLTGLKTAIAHMESLGQGNYAAVGPYVCDTRGLCGRGIGRYQFMTYREDVAAALRASPDGAELLEKAADPNVPGSEIAERLAQVLPPEAQEKLMDGAARDLIDGAAASGDGSPEAIVRAAAEVHNAGPAGRSPEYGKEAEAIYRQVTPGIADNCGENKPLCTGTFANPAPGYPKTDEYGACRPLGTCTRRHQGVDIGTPVGTDVHASDGGTIVAVSTRGCYGLTVDIQHCRSGRITRYAHLSSALVAPGATVKKGQVIAKSGASGCGSGPHLHFEVHPAGSPEDPEDYIPI